MIAAIIGAEGKMGNWFRDHLPKIGFEVVTFDERKGEDPSVLRVADVVIISVPVADTCEVIKKTVRLMKQGSTLVEIASLKSGIHEEMVKVAEKRVKAVSLHPMFGPSVKNLTGKTVALIPIRKIEMEKSWAERLFPGACLVEVNPEEHDKLMVHILSMPYLLNMALAATMKDADLDLLKKLSGTSFALQYTLVQSVAGETTSLVQALLSENIFLKDTTADLMKNIRTLLVASSSKQAFEDLHKEIREKMVKDPSHKDALMLRQAAYNAVKPLLR